MSFASRNTGASRKTLLALSLLAALGACGEKKGPKADDQRTASGQILPGTISDGMIPYDALTSQPPVAPRRASAVEAASGEEEAPTEAASAE